MDISKYYNYFTQLVQHFKNILDYCQAIRIAPPRYPYFDIRSFEENMATVVAQMPPFKHEFYAVAIKLDGSGKVNTGQHSSVKRSGLLFFNTPFQLLSWDILPDWKGYYIMFSKEFVAQSRHMQQLLTEFPFLKIDASVPFEIEATEADGLLWIYDRIYSEYRSMATDSLVIIESLVMTLLNYVQRYYLKQADSSSIRQAQRKADISLLSRFQTMIETSFYEEVNRDAKTHSPSYYAGQLAVHPNHLNATVKEITGHTAKAHIQRHLLRLAQSRLSQTDLSIKEIAYDLHFDSPNNFSAFFKKAASMTPNAYRKMTSS